MKRLVIATTNAGKVREIVSVLDGLEGWRVEPLPGGLPLADETGSTFVDNAVQKGEFYSRILGPEPWVAADDSGLVVDALDGRPGVFSSRYAPNDEARNRKLLGELRNVAEPNRSARFVCALALARNGGVVWTTEGSVEGTIALRREGTHGFGYDPVFLLPALGRTMAELPPEAKNRISHRGRALAMFRAHLESYGQESGRG